MKIKQIFLWTVAILVYLGLYGFRLSFPNEMYFDEIYEVKTARLLLDLAGYDSTHPPLGHMLMSLSILIFGDYPWVWRLPSLLAGLGSLMVLYALTKQLTSSARTAFFAVFLFGLGGLPFTQARIGTLNAVMLLLTLSSLLCFVKYAILKQWSQGKAFFLSGLFLGLALSTRWVSVLTYLAMGFLYLKLLKEEKDKGALLKNTFLCFILLPLFIYFSIFALIPAIAHFNWRGFHWSWIMKFQLDQIHYNLTLKKEHLYGSEWWGWPFLVRPIWYYFKSEINQILPNHTLIKGIFCIGNPAIFWTFPLALAYVLWNFVKNKVWVAGFVIVGFFSQWLPWAFVSRVKFFHYFYPVLPFAVIALALGLEKIWRTGKPGRILVTAYLVLVAGMFAYWYPLLNGMPISVEFYRHHIWFKSWI